MEERIIEIGDLDSFIAYNDRSDRGEFRGSEATPFDLDAAKTWLSIREKLTKVEDYSDGEWRALDIKKWHSKYGTNYIFIDIKNKKWRINEIASEFYGYLPPKFEERDID